MFAEIGLTLKNEKCQCTVNNDVEFMGYRFAQTTRVIEPIFDKVNFKFE